jgi:hypothetical protein
MAARLTELTEKSRLQLCSHAHADCTRRSWGACSDVHWRNTSSAADMAAEASRRKVARLAVGLATQPGADGAAITPAAAAAALAVVVGAPGDHDESIASNGVCVMSSKGGGTG